MFAKILRDDESSKVGKEIMYLRDEGCCSLPMGT
jgi:hypothetical protein